MPLDIFKNNSIKDIPTQIQFGITDSIYKILKNNDFNESADVLTIACLLILKESRKSKTPDEVMDFAIKMLNDCKIKEQNNIV